MATKKRVIVTRLSMGMRSFVPWTPVSVDVSRQSPGAQSNTCVPLALANRESVNPAHSAGNNTTSGRLVAERIPMVAASRSGWSHGESLLIAVSAIEMVTQGNPSIIAVNTLHEGEVLAGKRTHIARNRAGSRD